MSVASHGTVSNAEISSAPLPLAHWLTVLHHVHPAEQLTVLGAGNGSSALLHWANEQAVENVCLVEADAQQFSQLKAFWQPDNPLWQFHHSVMEVGEAGGTYYTASHPSENGLFSPNCFSPLWPNITTVDERPCEPILLNTFAAEHFKPAGQWLAIDYFSHSSLLTNNSNLFQEVDVLMVRVSTQGELPEGIDASAWENALRQANFHVVMKESERHPNIERWLCIRQPQQQKQALQSELAEVKQKLADTHIWFMNRKKQALEYEQQVATLEDTLKTTKEELALARQQSAQLKMLKETLNHLESRIEDGFAVQSEQRQQATNALGKHITQMLQPAEAQPMQETGPEAKQKGTQRGKQP